MTEAWQIWLLVILIIFTLYLIGFLYSYSRIRHFSKSMSLRIKSMSVILVEKKDVLLTLLALYDEEGIHLDSAEKKAAEKVRWVRVEVKNEKKVLEIVDTFSILQKRLSYLAEANRFLKKDTSYQIHKSALDDLDGNYRRIVALYNHDLVLYDYWRKTFLYRPIYAILPIKKWERLP